MQKTLNLALCLFSVLPSLACANPVQEAYRTTVDKMDMNYLTATDGSEFVLYQPKGEMNYLDDLVIYKVAGDWRICHDGNIFAAIQNRATLEPKQRVDLELDLNKIERSDPCY